MIVLKNKVVAEEGKYLKLGDDLKSEIYLGNNYIKKDGQVFLVNISNFNDVKEVYPVDINGVTRYISATEYGDIVTELIRTKYSINQELALYANYCIGKHLDEVQEFQDWRLICKEIAKKIINE